MAQRPTIHETLALGVLELSPMALSAEEISLNFDVDIDAANDRLYELADLGLAEHVGDGYYEPTPEGSMRVELRGGQTAA